MTQIESLESREADEAPRWQIPNQVEAHIEVSENEKSTYVNVIGLTRFLPAHSTWPAWQQADRPEKARLFSISEATRRRQINEAKDEKNF